jgi:mono/diheme cytochrome c family protein
MIFVLQRMLVAVLACCASIAPAVTDDSAQPAEALESSTVEGDPVVGKVTYLRVGCWTCHGYAAQGGLGTGPPLAPGKPYTFEMFANFLRAPYNLMPPYTAKVLSDDEVRDILAFVKSRPGQPGR